MKTKMEEINLFIGLKTSNNLALFVVSNYSFDKEKFS